MMFEPTASAVVTFFDFILKGFIILLIAFAADIALRKANASLRHLIWIISLTAILVLPVISPLIPQLDLPLLNFMFFQDNIPDISAPVDRELADYPSRSFSLSAANLFLVTFIIYIIGVVAVFVWQLSGRVHAIKMRNEASPQKDNDADNLLGEVLGELRIESDVALLVSHTISAPFSIGVIKPAIVLPKCAFLWPRSIMKSVLIHEAAHIKRMDLLSRGIAQLSCCINWFNPLAWFGFKKLLIEQEIACDNYVLSSGSKPSEYAQSLLTVANLKRSILDYALAAIGRKRELKDRLVEILKPSRSKNPLKWGRMLIFIFLALMLLLPLLILNVWYNRPTAQAFNSTQQEIINKQQIYKKEKPIKTHSSTSQMPLDDKSKSNIPTEKITEKDILEKISAMKEKGYSDKEIKKLITEMKKKMELEQEASKTPEEKKGLSDKNDKEKENAHKEKIMKENKSKNSENNSSKGGAKQED